jgi:hypothetical protein
MSAEISSSAPAVVAQLEYPAFMKQLVDRAAAQMIARGSFDVEFNWWSEGEDHAYTARMDWHEETVQLKVFDGRSGDFVCQSLPGKPFEIDPATWNLDPAQDEVDRFMSLEKKGHRKGSKR